MRLSHDRVTSGTRPDNGLLRSHRSLRKRRADAQRLADLRRAHARPRASCSHQEARANELRIFLSSSTDRFVSVTIALASLARRRRLFVGIGQSPPANFQRTNYARRNRRALTDVDQRRCPSFSKLLALVPSTEVPSLHCTLALVQVPPLEIQRDNSRDLPGRDGTREPQSLLLYCRVVSWPIASPFSKPQP